jgi:elongation factor G
LLAFKIMDDPFVGTITFCRIYSGTLESGTGVMNSTKERKERVGRMLLMHANNREDIKEAFAGDIVALAGLKEVRTGDTLCDPQKPVILEKMEFPEPVIEIAIEPKSKADQEKLGVALAKLVAEDPSFRVNTDPESGQTIIRGMGELHLEIIVDRMKREFRVDANVGVPQVAYRETITRASEIGYIHERAAGDLGQSARLRLVFAPGEAGSGFVFHAPAGLDTHAVEAIRAGLDAAKEFGIVAGFPVVDFAATLVDMEGSSPLALELAARAAFREGMRGAGPTLLEPVMRVEIVTPEEHMGVIIGDLNSRRGQISGMDQRGSARTIDATAPLANMFGYVNTLRSMSKGRARFTMQFDHYDPVPQAIADEVRAKLA